MRPNTALDAHTRLTALTALCRFAEPIALTSVFPYIPEMIESFGVPKDEIAKWAGTASAIFSLGQCLTSVFWGRASDKYGRKLIILLGLFNTMVMSLLWGFSTSLPMAMTVRALQGAGNGNVGQCLPSWSAEAGYLLLFSLVHRTD